MAYTGRDVAKFVTQVTGEDYLGFYDEAEEEDTRMKTEAMNRFNNILYRMNEVNKSNLKEMID